MGDNVISVRRYRLCTAVGSIKCEREDAERVAHGSGGNAWVETSSVMLLMVDKQVSIGTGGFVWMSAGTEILGPWERAA